LSFRDRLLIGKVCQLEWERYYDSSGLRPYRVRERILAWQATRAGWYFNATFTPRFVESCWTLYRKLVANGGEIPPILNNAE
jgi:hypothetical protein